MSHLFDDEVDVGHAEGLTRLNPRDDSRKDSGDLLDDIGWPDDGHLIAPHRDDSPESLVDPAQQRVRGAGDGKGLDGVRYGQADVGGLQYVSSFGIVIRHRF